MQEERELCARTVYVANIDKKVDKEDVRVFFQALCGEHTEPAPLPCVWVVLCEAECCRTHPSAWAQAR